MKTTSGTSQFFVGGEETLSEKTLKVFSPYDDSVAGETFLASPAQLEAAVTASISGFQQTQKLAAYERSEILLKIRQRIANEAEGFARILTLEAGKPIIDARREVERSLLTFEVAAEEAKRNHGEFLDLAVAAFSKNRYGIYRHFPVGPILGITPFNFPLNLVAHKLAPAIAIGTSFILKPSSKTPLSALKLAKIIVEAGYPKKAVNVLPALSSDIEALVKDDRIKALSFTGSGAVGWKLKSLAGKKKVLLELGGNAGVIIHEDADIAAAAGRCAAGAFSFAGQTCISVQRIFVHETVYPAFVNELIKRIKLIKSGDPLDESTTLGPMIEENAAKRSEAWIEEAVAQGATILCGGKRNGKFLEPTVLSGVTNEMKVCSEEVFAPMLSLIVYRDFEEAIQRVNNSRYGLQAGVFTNQLNRIMQAYSELDVGGVMVNEIPTWRVEPMPYGGVKDSGFGREGIRYAMDEMSEGKLLVF